MSLISVWWKEMVGKNFYSLLLHFCYYSEFLKGFVFLVFKTEIMVSIVPEVFQLLQQFRFLEQSLA